MSCIIDKKDRFAFYLDDLDCEYCLYAKAIPEEHIYACLEDTCRYENLRREAIENGRIKRKEGVNNSESD